MMIFYLNSNLQFQSLFSEKEILVPNKTDNNSFVYNSTNGSIFWIPKNFSSAITDYLTANQSCQAKGGAHLAVIDSDVKQNVVQSLIKKHTDVFGTKTASFLLGK